MLLLWISNNNKTWISSWIVYKYFSKAIIWSYSWGYTKSNYGIIKESESDYMIDLIHKKTKFLHNNDAIFLYTYVAFDTINTHRDDGSLIPLFWRKKP